MSLNGKNHFFYEECLFSHIKCKIFGHNWKIREIRSESQTQGIITDFENSELDAISKLCKRCGAKSIEFMPFEEQDDDEFVELF